MAVYSRQKRGAQIPNQRGIQPKHHVGRSSVVLQTFFLFFALTGVPDASRSSGRDAMAHLRATVPANCHSFIGELHASHQHDTVAARNCRK